MTSAMKLQGILRPFHGRMQLPTRQYCSLPPKYARTRYPVFTTAASSTQRERSEQAGEKRNDALYSG